MLKLKNHTGQMMRKIVSGGLLQRALQVLSGLLLSAYSWQAVAETPRHYYQEPAYRHQGNYRQDLASPEEVCAIYGRNWGWVGNGHSFQLLQEKPGLWKCQRYYHGALEPTNYAYIDGQCQLNPASIRTGSDWSYPYWDQEVGDCYCRSGKYFDPAVQWCIGKPPV